MILETIAEATRKRVAAEKEKCSLAEMKEKATAMNPDTGFPFEQALKKPGMSFICEVKKASPSKGIIAEDFPYLEIAKEYETAGASAISCLTEPEYFKGRQALFKKNCRNRIHPGSAERFYRGSLYDLRGKGARSHRCPSDLCAAAGGNLKRISGNSAFPRPFRSCGSPR